MRTDWPAAGSGDYRDSWQPAAVEPDHRQEVKRIATQAVQGLIAHAGTDTAWGVFGVELFVLKDGTVLFNEVSPARTIRAWSP